MIRRRTRVGYTSITRQSQILNHQSDENECENGSELLSGSTTSSNASSREFVPNTPSPVTYNAYGYKHSTLRTYLCHMISILCLGIPYLISHSSLRFFVWFRFKQCDLDCCDFVLVTNNRGQVSFERVLTIRLTADNVAYYANILKEINRDHASTNEIRIFEFEHVRYIYNNHIDQFVRLRQLDEFSTTNQLVFSNLNCVSDEQRLALTQIYGRNTIEIAVKSYWELFKTEILNPFYLFQIFSVTLWCFDDYYYYAGCVFLLSSFSIFCSLYETRAQSITLHNVIDSLKANDIDILNDSNDVNVISADDLVPGDIIVIPINGGIMACDAVLISGSCIVNESMLTGESVPVTKTPPTSNDAPFEWMSQKRHILYAGTTILQTRYYGSEKVLAKVVRTGFNTSKGELVKSILFPRPIEFRFYEDSVKFVSLLFVVATFGMVYTIYLYNKRGSDLKTIIVRALDIITIVVPPALPLAMTAGQVYSQARLKKKNIFCISPQRINVCGKLKLICFDKTGTLTDDGLTMDGCRECRNGEFCTDDVQPSNVFDEKSNIVQNMATCHSLTTINGTLNGDPLDLEMFNSIKWEYIEPGQEHTRFDNLTPAIVRPIRLNNRRTPTKSPTSDGESTEMPYSIGIIKQHQFSSEAQCMSVIVRVLGEKHMKVFAKGAPEKILSLCQPKSIPKDFYDVLFKYTSRGYRVIALAHKKLSSKIKWMEIERMKRSEIETDMIFDGFLILLNCLKSETTNVIEELHAAQLKTVMITGDNIMTALSVAKDCKMIKANEEVYIVKCENYGRDKPKLSIELSRNIGAVDDSSNTTENIPYNSHSTLLNIYADRYHFALDGTTWKAIQMHYPHFIPYVVARGTIFARFRPEQKSQIVICLKQYDYIVGFVGDGANDCGALKAAHIGCSLSKAEASVAAPFTSSEENISCIKHLALEGRCALVTSFGLFKYMIMYSFIQFICILILYTHSSILGNFQFLYVDLIITASLAFSMGRQGPAEKLVTRRPSSSLLSLANVLPLLLQVLLCTAIQLSAILYLFNQPWYKTDLVNDNGGEIDDDGDDERILCWENTVLFLISCYQYLILGVVYSKGLPYRKPVYTNGLLLLIVGLITTFTTWLLLRPLSFLSDLFEIKPYFDTQTEINIFRFTILVFPLIHLTLAYGIEHLIAERPWYKSFIHFIVRKKGPRNKFKQIENNLQSNNISELQRNFDY